MQICWAEGLMRTVPADSMNCVEAYDVGVGVDIVFEYVRGGSHLYCARDHNALYGFTICKDESCLWLGRTVWCIDVLAIHLEAVL